MQISVSIDGSTVTQRDVAHIEIRRGRQDELDRTSTGSAKVVVNIVQGRTNAVELAGAGQPLVVNLDGVPLFTGFIDNVSFGVDPSLVKTTVTFDCIDGLDKIRRAELAPDPFGTVNPQFGYEVPAGFAGQIFYEDAGTCALRINKVLDEVGWTDPRDVFSGNIALPETFYSPRTSALQVIDDVCEAEFPSLANRFIDKYGSFRFKGRFARFNPSDPQYDVIEFPVGMSDAGSAQLRDLVVTEDRTRLINAFLCTPKGILDHQISGQIYIDQASIDEHGLYSDSAENLEIDFSQLGTPNRTARAECLLYATYFVQNYSQPRRRVERVLFKSIHPDDYRAGETWNLLQNVDISHLLNMNVDGPGLTLAERYFVEGLTYTIRPAAPDYAYIELACDCSPEANYESNPF